MAEWPIDKIEKEMGIFQWGNALLASHDTNALWGTLGSCEKVVFWHQE